MYRVKKSLTYFLVFTGSCKIAKLHESTDVYDIFSSAVNKIDFYLGQASSGGLGM